MAEHLSLILISSLIFLAYFVSWCIFGIGVIQNIIYLLQLPFAWLEMKEYSEVEDTETSWELLLSEMTLPITILVPAYNETATIVANAHSLLALRYPNIEIFIINDGSTDDTLENLIQEFSLQKIARAHELNVPHAPIRGLYGSPLYPRLLVIDKENGKGKADATNAGINLARYPLFCVIDADSILEPEALLRVIRPFFENPKTMVAVGGTIRIANGCKVKSGQIAEIGLSKKYLPLIQTIEYIRAFSMARLAWSRWKTLTIISGAFGVFSRQAAVEVGGFSHGTVGEDMELIIKMHAKFSEQKRDYAMCYVPEPVCWTEAPQTFSILSGQRKRWQRGALETFFKHKKMLFNWRYGRIGLLGLPYSLITDVIGPIAETIGYILIPVLWYFHYLDIKFLLAFFALFILFGIFISIASLILEESQLHRFPRVRDLLWLIYAAIIENFGYRQLNNIWRILGWWQFLKKKKGWGVMTRKGF